MDVLELVTNITHLTMCGSGLALFIYGIRLKKSEDYLSNFVFISFLSFIDTLSLIVFYMIFKSEYMFNMFSDYFQIYYLSTEIITIIFFYLTIIKNIKYKYYVVITSLVGVILLLINYWFKYNVIEKNYLLFVIVEVLIINSCFGFILIKSFKSNFNIISKSQAEINKGLLIFINMTAPYYIVSDYLEIHKIILTTYTKFINDTGYIILFFQIYKALRCSHQK